MGPTSIPQDYHMHSDFSCDCKTPMRDMCRSAISKNVQEIGFTEHYDLHPDEPCRDWFHPEPWWETLQQCRAEFAGQLTVKAGIEVGEPHIFAQEMAQIVDASPFDYVIGALHWVGEESVFSRDYFTKRSADEAFTLFFQELERMTHAGGFDILAHFDVPVRVGFAVYGEYDPRRYEESIRPALQNCIDNGIALDLNTKALRSRPRVLTPGLDILRWYADMGGERVALGSDAHKPQNIGADLDVALNTARQAGLRHITFFEQRRACLKSIE